MVYPVRSFSTGRTPTFYFYFILLPKIVIKGCKNSSAKTSPGYKGLVGKLLYATPYTGEVPVQWVAVNVDPSAEILHPLYRLIMVVKIVCSMVIKWRGGRGWPKLRFALSARACPSYRHGDNKIQTVGPAGRSLGPRLNRTRFFVFSGVVTTDTMTLKTIEVTEGLTWKRNSHRSYLVSLRLHYNQYSTTTILNTVRIPITPSWSLI